MTDKYLDDLDDEDTDALFERLGKLIGRTVPNSRLGGKCGWILVMVDQAKGKGTPPTAAIYTGTVPPEDTPEVLHEVADQMEQDMDQERGDE